MTEKDLLSVAIQLPAVALAFYFIGREINALSKKIDLQQSQFSELVRQSNEVTKEANQVMREVSTAVVALKTMLEDRAEESKFRRTHAGN